MARPRVVAPEQLVALVREVVARGGQLELPVTGDSMRPALAPGDTAIWRPIRPGEPRLGQIVLCVIQGRPIAHRVVELRADSVVTAPDAAARADPPVPRANLLAVLDRRKRPLSAHLRLALQAGRRLFKRP